ncbi:helix-turn-helix domain-containing protein [Salmonella enterica]|nr:helix-turn-helix domain-containing protein [Salmonella enterica]
MTPELLNETIGGRIKLRRRSLGRTLAELGRQIGVSAAAISLWENGSTTPDAKRLEALSKSLYCTIEWLVDGSEFPQPDLEDKEGTPSERGEVSEPSSRPDLEEINNIYVILSPERRKKLVDYAYQLLDGYQNELSEKINLVKSMHKSTNRK